MNKTIVKENNINKFKTAKGKINRNIVLEVAETLDIKFKKGATVCIDETLWEKSGHNQEPIIIHIPEFSKTSSLKELIRQANNIAKQIYAGNKKGFTLVKNKDANIDIEIG